MVVVVGVWLSAFSNYVGFGSMYLLNYRDILFDQVAFYQSFQLENSDLIYPLSYLGIIPTFSTWTSSITLKSQDLYLYLYTSYPLLGFTDIILSLYWSHIASSVDKGK